MKKILLLILSAMIACAAVLPTFGCGTGGPFTVTFDGGAEDAVLVIGERVQVVNSWEEIETPVFNREGYNTDGWNKIIRNIESDTTVVQLWSKYAFSVTFNGNGGKTENGDETVVLGVDSAYTLKQDAPKFLKKGYTLSWDTVLETVSKTCTVNAIWTPNEYNINFVDEHGGNDELQSLKVVYDDFVGELPTLDNVTINGQIWRFVRWQDQNEMPVYKGMLWNGDEDVTLKAIWTEDEFVINYDLSGGSVINNPGSYSSGEEIVINNPTRYGYDFIGWVGSGISKATDQLTISKSDTGDKSYVAMWKAKRFTLDLDAAGGACAENKYTVTFDQAIKNIPTPVRENFEFIGWKCSDSSILYNNGVVWDNEPTERTLVAQYKRIYVLKFSLDTPIRGTTQRAGVISCEGIKLGAGQALEDFSLVIKEGETLEEKGITNLPIVDIYEIDGKLDGTGGEYSFGGYWKYSNMANGDTKLYKVLPDTIFNPTNFPGVKEDGVIVIIPHCRAHWTPSYKL